MGERLTGLAVAAAGWSGVFTTASLDASPEHAHDQDNQRNDYEKADQSVPEHGKSERHGVLLS